MIDKIMFFVFSIFAVICGIAGIITSDPTYTCLCLLCLILNKLYENDINNNHKM